MAPTRPGRILIIDDNVGLAENIAEILQLDGYETEVAASGEEALSKAVPGQLDVVVTDYRLPCPTRRAQHSCGSCARSACRRALSS